MVVFAWAADGMRSVKNIPQTMRIQGEKQSVRWSGVLCVLLLSCVLCLRIGEGSVTERGGCPKGKTHTGYTTRERGLPVGVRGHTATMPKRSSLEFPNSPLSLEQFQNSG